MKCSGRWWLGALMVGGSLLGGCALENAQAAFATDFNCPDATAEETNAPGRILVHGCGRRATYVCGNVCAIQTVEETGQSRPEEPSDSPPRRPQSEALVSELRVKQKEDGSVMVLELVLERRALLRLTASPDKQADFVQLKLVRAESTEDVDECNLDWMLNGQVMTTPKAVATRTKGVLSHRVQIGRELIAEFGTASKIALRACSERWALNREQVQQVRDFMDRFQEELAWKSPARDGSTAGMLAPSGGWPAWKVSATPVPKELEGPPLDGRTLFKTLSASVFQLEASRGEGMAQGSAVAVSATELLTNCHVVQGALKLTLKQGKQSWPARVVRADPSTDRCSISAEGATLRPVAGVRTWDSLEVGEAAYTLGSPVGLELTLSNGIISGRRDERDQHFVQTTAPISPGSSGGGLFDARGNLIGITTLVLVGREHLNQSLNFAIPADAFWQTK